MWRKFGQLHVERVWQPHVEEVKPYDQLDKAETLRDAQPTAVPYIQP